MALVLLHPLPLDGSAWDPVVDRLEANSIVIPSLYELGSTMAEWAAAVIDIVGSGPHTIVGNSIGASCGAEIAHTAPEVVDRLVLVGGKLSHRPEPSIRDEALRMLDEYGLGAAWDSYWAPLFGPSVDDDTLATARRCALSQDVDDIARGVRVFHSRSDRSDLCDRWRGRLDVVSGTHDRSPSPRVAAASLSLASRGQSHIVPAAGHYIPLEAPNTLVEILIDTDEPAVRAR